MKLATNRFPTAAWVMALGGLCNCALGASDVDVRVVSSRPEMVSGGDVLVQLHAPMDVSWSALINGRDVTEAFHRPEGDRDLLALLTGLEAGRNRLAIRAGGKIQATLEILNHPLAGPIFSGPHQEPFFCQTEQAGLGAALDANCAADTQIAYFYKSTKPANSEPFDEARLLQFGKHDCAADPCNYFRYLGFRDYDPTGPRPADLAQTTTTEGHRVDFIVRRERGTINRAIYDIYMLQQPGEPLPDPWSRARTPGWNGRLVFDFGAGGLGGFHQGLPSLPTTSPLAIISQGYALANSSLTGEYNNSDVTAAETMAMVKEHFIKEMGPPVHTIGWGGSGGSMRLMSVAENYPGLLDGIIPFLSFPDYLTFINPTQDCVLLDRVIRTSKLKWTDAQKNAVIGYAYPYPACQENGTGNGYIVRPELCGSEPPETALLPSNLVYDKAANPQGLRCDVFDTQINVWGRESISGSARRPLDNTGVEYGLVALNSGKISAEQFIDLNARIGGFDEDGNLATARTVANPQALRIAYQTGRVNSGAAGLRLEPIIDVRTYTDGLDDPHDSVRSFVMQARLLASNGRSDNQVILTFPSSSGNDTDPDSKISQEMAKILRQMDEWLDNVANDISARANIEKIARDKPSTLSDACWTAAGEQIVEPRTFAGPGRCHGLYPPHGDVRMAAGAPLSEDILKCTLKPVSRDHYLGPLTSAQLDTIRRIFPAGACNYSRPGVGQQNTTSTWQHYSRQ